MAGLRSRSYNELRIDRHRPAARIGRAMIATACLAGALALGGCGIVVPLSSLMGSSAEPPAGPGEITGSIPAATSAPEGATDAEAVRKSIEVSVARGVEAPIAWKNDATGNSGTVTASKAARAPNGAPCRDFDTTLTTVAGVDLYNGRICQGFTGGWEVLRFERAGG